MIRTGLLSLLALLAMASLAQAQQTTQKLIDAERNCGIFVAAWLARAYQHVQWSGPCLDGLAEGNGFVTFARKPGDRPAKVWQGNFRHGFFIGQAKAMRAIVPLDEHQALVELPSKFIEEATPWFVAHLQTDGPLPLCSDSRANIAIEIASAMVRIDETAVRRMMARAMDAYRLACPHPVKLRLAVIESGRLQALAGNFTAQTPDIVARALVDSSAADPAAPDTLRDFTLLRDASDLRRRAEEQIAQAERARATSRRKWQEFTRDHAVWQWLKLSQLDMPFRYAGKTIAFRARVFNVLQPSGLAVVYDSDGGMAVVAGLPPELAKRNAALMIAGRIGIPRILPSLRPGRQRDYPWVDASGWTLCQSALCAEFFEWMADEKMPFPWGGEPDRSL